MPFSKSKEWGGGGQYGSTPASEASADGHKPSLPDTTATVSRSMTTRVESTSNDSATPNIDEWSEAIKRRAASAREIDDLLGEASKCCWGLSSLLASVHELVSSTRFADEGTGGTIQSELLARRRLNRMLLSSIKTWQYECLKNFEQQFSSFTGESFGPPRVQVEPEHENTQMIPASPSTLAGDEDSVTFMSQ